ncbi:Retrovirus-related Pol polyprotein from transposon TNT 1-94, partial [Stegodyphus mimosarum]
MQQIPYPKAASVRARRPLELIHSDICGPMPTPSIGGKLFFVTFIDDFTGYTVIYLLAKNSEVLSKLKDFVGITRNKFGRTMQTLRTDNGGEYTSEKMEEFLSNNGIKHQLTVPFSPPQNGVSERKNRSLTEMPRCLLSQSRLPNKFWGGAVNTANYIQNSLPTRACDKTPYELWRGRKPNLAHMKQFGCTAYAYIHKENRKKLDQKVTEEIFVGYDQRSKGYLIYTGEDVENDEETTEKHKVVSEEEPRRSEMKTKGKPPERLGYLTNTTKTISENFKDLDKLNSEEKEKWLLAVDEEINSLSQNKTWELFELPVGKKPVDGF